MKKIITTLSIVLTVLLLGGCTSTEVKKSDLVKYSSNGISINMPSGFTESEDVNFTVFMSSQKAMFTALKESFTVLEPIGLNSESSLAEYAEVLKKTNGFDNDFIKEGNFMYNTYTREVNNQTFFYVGVVYKSNDAFWLINFACLDEDKDTYKPKFIEWAKTVEFE